MRIKTLLVTVALLAPAAAAVAEPAPTWRNGDLTCPDGSVAPLHTSLPWMRPTAPEMQRACFARSNRKLLNYWQNPPMAQRPSIGASREEERRQAANFLGATRPDH
jgi:hypothetical protein